MTVMPVGVLASLPVLPIDQGVAEAIQRMRTPFGDVLLGVITRLGNGALIWVIVGVMVMIVGLLRQHGQVRAVTLGTAMVLWGALALGQVLVEWVIKPITLKPRPLTLHPDWNYLDLLPTSTSFPSGHACWAWCAVPILWGWDRRAGYGALAFALVMMVSRVYVAAHWVTDVLAGGVLGLLIGLGCAWILRYRLAVPPQD